MAKPILTVGVPMLTAANRVKISEELNKRIKDYHNIIYVTCGDEVKFEVFYEKDMSEIELSELKELVVNGILEREQK